MADTFYIVTYEGIDYTTDTDPQLELRLKQGAQALVFESSGAEHTLSITAGVPIRVSKYVGEGSSEDYVYS